MLSQDSLPKTITAPQRINKARELIQIAKNYPLPPGLGYRDLAYVAQIKDILRQARDLIKFIHYSPSLTDSIKEETARTLQELQNVEKDLLHT